MDRHAWRGGGERWTKLDLPEGAAGTPLKAKACTQTLVAVKCGEDLLVLRDVCSHQACSLTEGKVSADAIECGCRGSRFGLTDGAVLRVRTRART